MNMNHRGREMSLRIGDKVRVYLRKGTEEHQKGIIRNLKYNLVQVEFANGQGCDWIDGKHIKHDTETPEIK